MESNCANNADDWASNFLAVLVSPKQTLHRLVLCAGSRDWLGAAAIVSLAGAANGLLACRTGFSCWVPFLVCAGVFFFLLNWLLLALVLAMPALVFSVDSSRIKGSFIALAWSFTPWILAGPVTVYQRLIGPYAIVFHLALAAWVAVLILISLKAAYRLAAWQMQLVLIWPFLLTLTFLWWNLQIISNAIAGSCLFMP